MANIMDLISSGTVTVGLVEWSVLQQKVGRVNAACEYIRHVLNDGHGYFNSDDARIVLMLLGENSNETEEENNQTGEGSEAE